MFPPVWRDRSDPRRLRNSLGLLLASHLPPPTWGCCWRQLLDYSNNKLDNSRHRTKTRSEPPPSCHVNVLTCTEETQLELEYLLNLDGELMINTCAYWAVKHARLAPDRRGVVTCDLCRIDPLQWLVNVFWRQWKASTGSLFLLQVTQSWNLERDPLHTTCVPPRIYLPMFSPPQLSVPCHERWRTHASTLIFSCCCLKCLLASDIFTTTLPHTHTPAGIADPLVVRDSCLILLSN